MLSLSQQVFVGFAIKHDLEGLTISSLRAIAEGHAGYSVAKARRFLQFQNRINLELLRHDIIIGNRYTEWFRQGDESVEQIKAFIVQFSVFSNQFLIAQLNKMINADTLEGMRASKEILANEIGVGFKPENPEEGSDLNGIEGFTEGSIEGGTFRFRAAHFEWLLLIAEKLGLSFADVGRAKHGTRSTRHFCNELIRLYGSANYEIAQASSYAVENWAAAGFWKELIKGFKRFNERSKMNIPIGFFVWHDQIEAQHAAHTQEELEELYFTRDIHEDAFIVYGNEMLDGVAVFWEGLDDQRRQLAAIH